MIHPATDAAIEQAAAILRRGGAVAFPTETVYGLGAEATNPTAVARVFEIKGRPRFDPLIVHVASADEARQLWTACPAIAGTLMRACWPGPLTLVLPKTDRIPDLVTAGLETVAVRMPDHPVAQRLLQLVGGPIAAPSANRFGRPSPTTAQAVEQDVGDAVGMILDGGPTRVGIESTVLAFDNGRPVVLRPGGVTVEQLTAAVGPVAVRARGRAPVSAPGLLDRHYAPATPLYLLEDPQPLPRGPGAWRPAQGRIGVLSLAVVELPMAVAQTEVLSRRSDLVEAAANFFQALRRLDLMPLDMIVATPMPAEGLGLALRDRLTRAASGWARLDQQQLLVLDRPVENSSLPEPFSL